MAASWGGEGGGEGEERGRRGGGEGEERGRRGGGEGEERGRERGSGEGGSDVYTHSRYLFVYLLSNLFRIEVGWSPMQRCTS